MNKKKLEIIDLRGKSAEEIIEELNKKLKEHQENQEDSPEDDITWN